jgi:hypothetical protein
MRVVNKRTHAPTPQDVYIGRPSILGNPFVIGKDGSRGEVIAKYARYAYERYLIDPAFANAINTIPMDANLVCWCAPEHCHGDVVKTIRECQHYGRTLKSSSPE